MARAEFKDGSGSEIVLLTSTGWVGTRGPIPRNAESVFTFHPLAVIDPEGGDPDTLYDLYREHASVVDVDVNRRGMRNALRAYASPEPPAPPKPEEPLRLGSTAEDRNGLVWIRASRLGVGARAWAPLGEITNPLRWRSYVDIDVVEVGVE